MNQKLTKLNNNKSKTKRSDMRVNKFSTYLFSTISIGTPGWQI